MNKKYIFLDTCVIQDIGSKKAAKAEKIEDYLVSLTSKGYVLTISEFTLYENLHGLWGEQITKAINLLHTYERQVVSEDILSVAAILGSLYHDESNAYGGIETGDKIIAATAILERGIVLTRDHKGYPSPFFINEKSIPLSYKNGNHIATIDYALYKPNTELINRRVSEKDITNK